MELRLCLVVVVLVSSAGAADISDYDGLISRLLLVYNRMVPPMVKGTNVSHSLNLKKVVSLEDQVLTLKTLLFQSWHDPRLSWDPADHGDIDHVTIPASAIWLPDIALYNDAAVEGAPPEVKVHVESSGQVTWVPALISRSYCDYKIKPNKKNRKVTCKLVFGSWSHEADELDLFNVAGELDLTGFAPSQTWKLKESSSRRVVKKFSCCPQEYSTLEYELQLKALV